jgi:UDP-N-acetylglucosamine 2-epimerase (non-hydrolysing)
LAAALARRGLSVRLFLTGQHPLAVSDYALGEYSSVELGCRGGGDPQQHARAVAGALAPILRHQPPAMLVVQGDTSSALGGAIAAAAERVPLAHVEAGLRSHDRMRPWPEEDFRIAIDQQAQLLFAPTAIGAANLRRERVSGEVHVTGNTAMDALMLPIGRRERSGAPRILVTCHRRESWGEGMRSVASALHRIAGDELAEIEVLLHPNPQVGQAMLQLLGTSPRIRLRSPCGHSEMLALMARCDLLLSDSGGVQEEAPALGIPLLVLRERTERPEAIASGNAILVGTDADLIVATVQRLLSDSQSLAAMAGAALPFGTPGASNRIAAIVARWTAERSGESADQPFAFASRAAARTASA